ncbi:hypothetical protein ACIQYL_20900 [Lysinibacillus xylanilyticus]|uniref:hypothetical protein n=1 Tax=Lysinibacillus xylanilyticus TaxID=582475 RepID=UPI00380738E5
MIKNQPQTVQQDLEPTDLLEAIEALIAVIPRKYDEAVKIVKNSLKNEISKNGKLIVITDGKEKEYSKTQVKKIWNKF